MGPLIGVLPLFDKDTKNVWINPRYMGGLEKAGGSPILLNLTEDRDYWAQMCRLCDGFLFTGGPDVEPGLYGHEKIPECGFILPARDDQELYMLHWLLDADKPILGICRGVQVLNVAAGGDMYQDIPAQKPDHIQHAQMGIAEFTEPTHSVTVLPGTRLRKLTGEETLQVNSMHHQAVWSLGQGMVTAATAPDGLIEAIESTAHRFAMGVQWHPEFLWDRQDCQLNIFRGLIEAC